MAPISVPPSTVAPISVPPSTVAPISVPPTAAPSTKAIAATSVPTTSAIVRPVTKTGIRVGPKVLQKCPKCNLTFYKKNLKRHIERRHTAKMMDISSSSHLKSECIDPQNGLYAVHKSIHGASTPLHVQIKIWGEQHHVSCELGECQANMELAWRSGLQSYQCVHLRSVSYCKTFLTSPSLREDSLKEMVKSKWFGKDKIKLCVDRQTLAKENNAPLSVLSKIGAPPSKKFISVHEPTISYYSRLGRVMVSYDTKKNSWHCPCAKTQRSCTHKYIAKWHLFQTNAELFRRVRSTERSGEEFQVTAMEESDGTHVGENTYPPKDAPAIQGMVQYILMNKKIPSTIPNHLRLSSVDKEFPRHLIPEETLCYHCPNRMVLSDPICITQKAKILTTSGIVQGGLLFIFMVVILYF